MAFAVNESRVVSETLEGETILINLETGTYYSLNGSATLVWDGVVKGCSFEQIVKILSERYDAGAGQIEKGAADMIDLLKKDRLIMEKDGAAEPPIESYSGSKAAFEIPKVESYSDMQEMLLSDPVHDVDQRGWPILKENT